MCCIYSFIKQPYALLLFAICAHAREFKSWIVRASRWVQCLHTRSHHWTPDPTVARYFNGKTKKCMTPSNTELHWRVYKNEPQISSKDFPKVNDPSIGVYGNVFCLDKSTWSLSFKVRIVADQKWKNRWICVHLVLGPRIRRESRVMAPEWGNHGPRMGQPWPQNGATMAPAPDVQTFSDFVSTFNLQRSAP